MTDVVAEQRSSSNGAQIDEAAIKVGSVKGSRKRQRESKVK